MAGETAGVSAVRALRFLLVGVIVVPLLVFAGGAYLVYAATVQRAEQNLMRAAAVAEAQATKVLDTQKLVLNSINNLLGGLGDEEVRARELSLHEEIAREIKGLPSIETAWVLDKDGRLVLSARRYPAATDGNYSGRDYFRALRDPRRNIYIGVIDVGALSGHAFFTVARRRERMPPEFDGVIVVAVTPDYFRSYYDTLIAGGPGRTAGLFRDDGADLARYPAPAKSDSTPAQGDLPMEAVAHAPQGGILDDRSAGDGVERVIAYRKVENYPAYVTVGRTRSSIVREWLQIMVTHLYFGIPAMAGLMLLALFALRHVRSEQSALALAREAVRQREAAEEALRQPQKMEAMGQLIGGISHDFNNLLAIIIGDIETLQRKLPIEDLAMARRLDLAMRAAERAATLTQRLLAFSRRQPLNPRPLEVNRLVAGMSDLLRRTLGESVAIETVLAGGLWWVSADANQLESALLNLAVNARDAIPKDGKLTIETSNVYLDDAYALANADVSAGQYVMVAISNTGIGMSKEAIAKAFEPFFTTKEVGQGTGLGLSQVYGFVKQSGGHVKIYSEPGEGATVRLYLPRLADTQGQERGMAARTVSARTRSETILVVEDDEDVRAHSVEILEELGYHVLMAPDGHVALRLVDETPVIDLLFTDVGLPGGLNGRELADEARRRRPTLKVLFTTGYARNAIVHQGRLDPGVDLILKPFTYAGLAERIRHVLERGAAPES